MREHGTRNKYVIDRCRCDDCRDEACCEVRIAFAKAYNDYLSTLESLSLAEVMRQSDAAIPSRTTALETLSGGA